MKEIKCPKCGTVITVDDADFAALLSQVRTEEFNAEVERRVTQAAELQKAQEAEKAAREDARHKEELSGKDNTIELLKQEIKGWEEKLKLQVEAARIKAEQKATEELNQKEAELRSKEEEKNRIIREAANEKENAAEREKALVENHRIEVDSLKKEVELYKSFKAKRSVKLLGEDLEQHCYTLYVQNLQPLMPNASFKKDNVAVKDEDETKGTKGDFIFRDKEGDVEYVSIMFEMKNEGDASSNKKKNSEYFEKLDKDRKKKECEFAVLVSMLEMDNELYNNGIVSVPGYEKMYVVRPDNFIPIITLLVQTSKKALEYKTALVEARQQTYDVSRFEDSVQQFRDSFKKNVTDANNRFNDAIKGIDDAIKELNDIKKNLQVSIGHLTAAENKVEKLKIRQFTKDNPTMQKAFAEVEAMKKQQALDEGPDEQ